MCYNDEYGFDTGSANAAPSARAPAAVVQPEGQEVQDRVPVPAAAAASAPAPVPASGARAPAGVAACRVGHLFPSMNPSVPEFVVGISSLFLGGGCR